MLDAAVLCMLLLLIPFSGIGGRSSKLSNTYLCVYSGMYLVVQRGRGCYDCGVGRLLELKLGAVFCERALLHPNLFWVGSFSHWVLGLESVCTPSCLSHCHNSCVSLSGTGMQLFLQQSCVPRVQPQLPQTIFSTPGI